MGKKKNAAIEAEWVEFRNSVYETKFNFFDWLSQIFRIKRYI